MIKGEGGEEGATILTYGKHKFLQNPFFTHQIGETKLVGTLTKIKTFFLKLTSFSKVGF